MSTFSFTDKPVGFRFTRPSLGSSGAAAELHPHVTQALDELEALLCNLIGSADPNFERIVTEKERDAASKRKLAAEIADQARRAEREADEAAREHDAAESVAKRLTDELNERRQDGGKSTQQPDVVAQQWDEAAQQRDEARNNAAAAHKIAEERSRKADVLQSRELQANATARDATNQAAEARRELERSQFDAIEILRLPVYGVEREGTLYRFLEGVKDMRNRMSAAEYIDREGRTGELYEVKRLISLNGNNLDYNIRHILSRARIVDYLFARAAFAGKLSTPEAIFNALVSSRGNGGWRSIYGYGAVRALETIRDERQINIAGNRFAQMAEKIVGNRATPVSLQQDAFSSTTASLLRQFVYDADEKTILDKGLQQLGLANKVTPTEYAQLLQYIKSSNEASGQIDEANAAYFVSNALAKLRSQDVSLTPGFDGRAVDVEDYFVDYYDDAASVLEYDRASIQAAAQLYLTMVWGDELGIFESVNLIATQGAPRLRLEVRSRQLSDDLRMYVLDEEFRDLRGGNICRRVSPAERHMFYRQMFGVGDAAVVDESQTNTDFPRLWAVLMTEVVKYIGKVEENPEGFGRISAQKVYQAIEDLQYNLSAYASGMVKVAAPAIHAEMHFVVRRILDSDDVKSQLARRGAQSFWKVVEEARGFRDFTPLRNKGRFGHQILSTIATATPDMLNDTTAFADFISTVEAYILAEDQLADAAPMPTNSGSYPGFRTFEPPSMGIATAPGATGTYNGNGVGDEWSF